MKPLEEYSQLQSKLETLEREAAQAEGGLREIKNNLKRKFDISTIKEAKQQLKQLREKEKELERKCTSEMKQFQRDYSNI